MRKSIFSLFLLISLTNAKATNYYFSSLVGDDARTPLQARNPSSPWKSLDRLNSFFSELKPGDSVLLKRGETFYGTINISKSGTTNLPIAIGAYGPGRKPAISGFMPVSMTSLGNNLYESQPLSSSDINVVTLNGTLEAKGRYPNSGYLNFESHTGTVSITDNELAATPNWTGAELVLRSRRWVLDKDLIVNHSGNTIIYKAASRYEPRDKYGYFIQNSPLALDEQGEWYFNPATKKLLIYSTAEPKNVNVAIINNLITSSGNSNITIYNVTIEGANKNAIGITSGSNISVLNCDILFSGEFGIKVNNHRGFRLENSSVVNSLNNGIDLGTNSPYAVLRNNLVQNTSVLPGMGASSDHMGMAIFTKSANNLIEYNKVINSGYVGIYFAGDSATIKNNFVDTFCTVKDDGGGIYSYIGGGARRVGRKIIGNIVLNGIGAPEGTDNLKQMAATGIYLDDNTSDIEITDNTVADCNNQGIFIQNTSSVIVKNNTFFDNNVQLSMIQRPDKLVRNNTISENIFFSRLPNQMTSYFLSAANDVDQFAKFANNYYVKPLDNKLVIFNSTVNTQDGSLPSAELAGWKQRYGRDENIKRITTAVAPAGNATYAVRFEYNATKNSKPVSLDGTYVDLKNKMYSNSIVLQPFSSAVLIKQK